MIRLQALRKSNDGILAEFIEDDGHVADCVFTVETVDDITVASAVPDLLFPTSGLSAEEVQRIIAAVTAFANATG